MFWCFGCEACGFLVPYQGLNPHPLHWKGEVLTTGPPGKSQDLHSEEVVNHATGKLQVFLKDQFKARSCEDSPPTIPSLDPGRERHPILLVANS